MRKSSESQSAQQWNSALLLKATKKVFPPSRTILFAGCSWHPSHCREGVGRSTARIAWMASQEGLSSTGRWNCDSMSNHRSWKGSSLASARPHHWVLVLYPGKSKSLALGAAGQRLEWRGREQKRHRKSQSTQAEAEKLLEKGSLWILSLEPWQPKSPFSLINLFHSWTIQFQLHVLRVVTFPGRSIAIARAAMCFHVVELIFYLPDLPSHSAPDDWLTYRTGWICFHKSQEALLPLSPISTTPEVVWR